MQAPDAFPSSVRAVGHVFLDRLDDTATVEGDDAHHLRRVLRVRDGEVVTAADGHGRWRAYEVSAEMSSTLQDSSATLTPVRGQGGGRGQGGEASTVSLHATTELTHEPRLSPGLTVACALTKGERPELVVQKLTELGADAVVLVRAARSVVRWDDARAASALARLGRIAREAGAQCRRARLPVLDGPVTVDELARAPGLVVADPGGIAPVDLPFPPEGAWTVAVGPEGGFTDDELSRLGGAPRLALGPHVLRAETAAIAAAAALASRRIAGHPER